MSRNHKIACWIAAAVAILSLLWAISSLEFNFPSLAPGHGHLNAIALVFLWTLAPPVWFAVEWKIWRSEPSLAVEQTYARNFWLGTGAIVVFLAAHSLISAPMAPASRPISLALPVEGIKAIAWPLVAMIAFFLLQEPLGAFLSGIGARASKIGAFNVTIELAALPDAQKWSGPNLDELKDENPAVAQDSSGSLFRAVADTTHADYVTVDLRNGEAWLTSRLFALTAIIARVRAIQRIVFLQGTDGSFLGECSPLSISQALARKYPWFEQLYLSTFVVMGSNPVQVRDGRPLLGKIAPNEATMIMGEFLNSIKQYGTLPPPDPSWTVFAQYAEHAEWISRDSLKELMGRNLNTVPVPRDPSEDGTAAARTLLRHDEDYVAIVDMAGRFLRLVDRRKANDQAVRGMLATKS